MKLVLLMIGSGGGHAGIVGPTSALASGSGAAALVNRVSKLIGLAYRVSVLVALGCRRVLVLKMCHFLLNRN